jgi:murein DD-endopeptidase MepM/ murein hydrolase activator NlpD
MDERYGRQPGERARERRGHRGALARAAVLAAIGASALFLAACGGSPEAADERSRDIPLPIDGESIEARVPPNATLEKILRAQNLPPDAAVSLIEAVRGVFNPRDLRANQVYRITRTLDGLFREFRYQIDADRILRVVAPPGTTDFTAEVITLPKEFQVEALELPIGKGDSLVGVLESRGENVQLALELANIYGGEVDFNSDLQPGDRIEVLFERAMRMGEFAGYGQVKAAILETGGRQIHAVLFPDADGGAAYYDEEGRSLKRQFLKSPLPFDPRITSRFSTSRLHPIYGVYRAHLGVDYAAPYGTAVNVVAAGVVEFVGMSGDAGRMVRVRHAGGYETAYLHLSAYAPGLRAGKRVAQGDFIGRVGSSGASTGPHLDYRIIKNSKYVDPIAELKRMPKGEPIAASRLAAFSAVRDEELGHLAALVDELRAAAAQAPDGQSGSGSDSPPR